MRRKENMDVITNIDFAILNFIYERFSCGLLDFLMPKITALGNGGVVWIIAAVILICSKKYRSGGIIMLVCLVTGVLACNVILKPLIARPRPCWINESLKILISVPTDYSFPSGHTLSSAIGATSLTIINPKFGITAIPLAILIAFSRLYLYVHFPSDVLASIAIGLIIVFVFSKIFSSLSVS